MTIHLERSTSNHDRFMIERQCQSKVNQAGTRKLEWNRLIVMVGAITRFHSRLDNQAKTVEGRPPERCGGTVSAGTKGLDRNGLNVIVVMFLLGRSRGDKQAGMIRLGRWRPFPSDRADSRPTGRLK